VFHREVLLLQPPFSLTLYQRALLLLALPLAFQLVLLATLSDLFNQAEAAEHSKAVIAKTKETLQLFSDVGFSFIAYDAATNRMMEKRYLEVYARVPAQMSELAEMVRNDERHRQIVERVNLEVGRELKVLSDNKRVIDAGGRMNVPEAFTMLGEMRRIETELDVLIKEEMAAQSGKPERAAQTKESIKRLVWFGFFSNIVIVLALIAFFHQSTGRRLKLLMENMSRFSKNEPPVGVPLGGRDEVALIDRVFREMANSLTLAARQKQEFVDMISHDLRTPLSAVQAALGVLASGTWGQLTDKAQQKVLNAEDNIRRSISLINNLLDFEKMQSGKLEVKLKEQPLAPVLDICADSVSQLAEKKDIRLNVPHTDAVVKADNERLSQVVVNFLGNAVKFSPAGSEITITVVNKAPFVEVRVTDNGPGIPLDHQKLVFERFHQAPGDDSAKKQGTGLGLAICKMIIEAHGGEIGVDSEPGKGSTFWFRVLSG
jgi:signal transduction histidine kinase